MTSSNQPSLGIQASWAMVAMNAGAACPALQLMRTINLCCSDGQITVDQAQTVLQTVWPPQVG